jgi:small subunit ribosomal protein S5
LHHDILLKTGAGVVCLRAAPAGTGAIVGGAMRALFEALGVQDVVGKSIGTSNYHNVIRATFEALRQVSPPRYVASKLGKKLSEINERRGIRKPREGVPS